MLKALLASSTAGLALLVGAGAAFAQTEISFWHSMSGELGVRVAAIADAFNASQSEYVVTPSYRGEYEESMVNTIAAFRAGEQPVIVQVYEVGTGTMMAAEGAVYPVYQLMAEHGNDFDPEVYLPVVTGYYTDTNGNMLSMPFNSSTPILYYNKDAFAAAGLDPEVAPRTWADAEAFSRQIIEAGAANCGMAITYTATWIGSENFSALHNLPYGTLENGFGGLGTEFDFDSAELVRFWDDLARWQDEKIFAYGGPAAGSDNGPAFYSGECAIFMGSSASRAGVLANTNFEVGFGMLPYYDDVAGAPQNSIIGGATLWVLQGHDDAEYEAAAAFLNYLSSAEVQAEWHQETGYLPVTLAAFELSRQQGYYDANPGADIAIQQINLNAPTPNSKGIRFGNMPQVRMVMDEELQSVLAGEKTGQEALDSAIARGNQILRDFQAANS